MSEPRHIRQSTQEQVPGFNELLEAAKYAAEMLSQPVGSTGREESLAQRLAGVGGLRAKRLLEDAIAKAEGKEADHA
jgi:hypothetical protein